MPSLMCKSRKCIDSIQSLNVLWKGAYNSHRWRSSTSARIKTLYVRNEDTQRNCAPLMPFIDIQNVFKERKNLEYSIQHRQSSCNLLETIELYEKYKEIQQKLNEIERKRDAVSQQLHSLVKAENTKDNDEIVALKATGKTLRDEWKNVKTIFHNCEDAFIENYLNLPNILQTNCPVGDHERLIFRHQQRPGDEQKSSADPDSIVVEHLQHTNYIKYIDMDRYFLMDEAAEFDVKCPQALADYLVMKAGFLRTANPDFVRRILLEANDSNLQDVYHQIRDEDVDVGKESFNDTYLTGGASFESYLGNFAKLSVMPNTLPIKWVTNGRLYEKNVKETQRNLYSATQNNAVQVFVATSSATEAADIMDSILNDCVDFYRYFNIHFRIVYIAAKYLSRAESLRAQIEIYSPIEQRYICIGRISNYSDYISKRILFNTRNHKQYQFPYMIGGPILYTGRLIAAILEHRQAFIDPNSILNPQTSTKSLESFKELFQ